MYQLRKDLFSDFLIAQLMQPNISAL